MPSVLSVKEAASMVGVEPATVEAWIRQGLVPSIRSSRGAVYLPAQELKDSLCTDCGKAPARIKGNNGSAKRGLRCDACAGARHKEKNLAGLCEECRKNPRYEQEVRGRGVQRFRLCRECLTAHQVEGKKKAKERAEAHRAEQRAKYQAEQMLVRIPPKIKAAIREEADELGVSMMDHGGRYLFQGFKAAHGPGLAIKLAAPPRKRKKGPWWGFWRRSRAA